MSWGHDEYLYHVVEDYLADGGALHDSLSLVLSRASRGQYDYLMNHQDRKMLKWVQAFNPYDLYTKSQQPPNVKELRPFYDDLIAEFFPPVVNW